MLIEIRRVDGPVGFDGNVFLADYANAHFLAAYDGKDPVGQICHVYDGLLWLVESLCVHQRLRGFNLGLTLIEANYHLALENGITTLYSNPRKGFGAEPETFARNSSRMRLGDECTLRETHNGFFVQRKLAALQASIQRGEVSRIAFPYQVTLQQKAQSA